MNPIKLLHVVLITLITTFAFGQELIEEKENEVIDLQTLDFEVIISDTNDANVYYSHTIYSGYKYPTIKEGFYRQSIFVRGDELIDFYEEMIRVSNMQDGTYKLTKKYGDISKVEKKRNKIKMYYITYHNQKPFEGTNAMGFVGTVKIKFLEEDLELIKKWVNHYNDKY